MENENSQERHITFVESRLNNGNNVVHHPLTNEEEENMRPRMGILLNGRSSIDPPPLQLPPLSLQMDDELDRIVNEHHEAIENSFRTAFSNFENNNSNSNSNSNRNNNDNSSNNNNRQNRYLNYTLLSNESESEDENNDRRSLLHNRNHYHRRNLVNEGEEDDEIDSEEEEIRQGGRRILLFNQNNENDGSSQQDDSNQNNQENQDINNNHNNQDHQDNNENSNNNNRDNVNIINNNINSVNEATSSAEPQQNRRSNIVFVEVEDNENEEAGENRHRQRNENGGENANENGNDLIDEIDIAQEVENHHAQEEARNEAIQNETFGIHCRYQNEKLINKTLKWTLNLCLIGMQSRFAFEYEECKYNIYVYIYLLY